MNAQISKDPLHGVTLEMQVNALVARYGWSELGDRIKINCFTKFLCINSHQNRVRKFRTSNLDHAPTNHRRWYYTAIPLRYKT